MHAVQDTGCTIKLSIPIFYISLKAKPLHL